MTRVLRLPAWWVMQPGTGSAYWYLALKNAVLDSGVKPKVVFIFFRDFLLTDVLFRVDDQFRWTVDTLAGPVEPELDRAIARRLDGSWQAVPRMLDAAYAFRPVRAARRHARAAAARPGGGRPRSRGRAAAAPERLVRARQAPPDDCGGYRLGGGRARRLRAHAASLRPAGHHRASVVRTACVSASSACSAARALTVPPVQSPVLRRYISDLRRYVRVERRRVPRRHRRS